MVKSKNILVSVVMPCLNEEETLGTCIQKVQNTLEELGIQGEAVNQLPPKQYRVFQLRYQEELSIKEIASCLNKSEGTIKAHLHHAHRKLRNLLRPYLQNVRLKWLETT